MPASANDFASASLLNCGYRFDPGNDRTSANNLIPFSSSNEMKTSISRVECPIVQIRTDQRAGFGGATASAMDFNLRPRSLLVEMTAVVSFSNAARITSRLRRNE